jgi:TetR/AcrR family transcriptional regulator, transcriptional repressor for nem operon
MRYEKGHKGTTRKHIVKVASERFRRDGIEDTGLAGLMVAAGLTHGGFYSHFRAKEELVGEAVNYALKQRLVELYETAKTDGLAGILHSYLRPLHVDAPASGCAFAALTPEIARHSRSTRAAFTQKYGEYVELIMASPRRLRRSNHAATSGIGHLHDHDGDGAVCPGRLRKAGVR